MGGVTAMVDRLMSTLIPNTLQYPNFYVDELMCLLTPEENMVLMFASRQILGWDDTRDSLKARIALSVFSDGYKSNTGFRNCGTGLSVATIKKCLDSLCEFNILVRHDTNNDGTEYSINFSRDSINLYELGKRKQEKDEREKGRHEKAVKAMHEKRGITPKQSTVLSDTTPSVLPDNNIKPKTNETKESGAKNAPPLPEKKKEFLDPLLEAAKWEQEHGKENRQGVSNPRAELKEYKQVIAPALGTVFRHDAPSNTDKSAAAKLFNMNYPRDKALEFLKHASNGGGERYRTARTKDDQPLNAYHVVNDMDEWRANKYPPLAHESITQPKMTYDANGNLISA